MRSFYYDVTAAITRSPILSLIVTSQQLKTLDCSQSSITEKGMHNSYHLYLTTHRSLLNLFNFAQITVYIYRDEKQLNIKYIYREREIKLHRMQHTHTHTQAHTHTHIHM